jgi:hypothetical protein
MVDQSRISTAQSSGWKEWAERGGAGPGLPFTPKETNQMRPSRHIVEAKVISSSSTSACGEANWSLIGSNLPDKTGP